jgi:hypothetical protein
LAGLRLSPLLLLLLLLLLAAVTRVTPATVAWQLL